MTYSTRDKIVIVINILMLIAIYLVIYLARNC